MKAIPFTVSAPYISYSTPVTVYAYDTESAIRKGCVHFPAGAYLVATKQ